MVLKLATFIKSMRCHGMLITYIRSTYMLMLMLEALILMNASFDGHAVIKYHVL